MEELYLFDDSQFPIVYNNQPEFYDNTESFPTISNEMNQNSPPSNNNTSHPSSSSSLASQMKMGMPVSSNTSTPSFGFAAKMRNPMSLLPENQAETYNTDGSLHRPGTPPSCVQFVIKTKKSKSKNKKRK